MCVPCTGTSEVRFLSDLYPPFFKPNHHNSSMLFLIPLPFVPQSSLIYPRSSFLQPAKIYPSVHTSLFYTLIQLDQQKHMQCLWDHSLTELRSGNCWAHFPYFYPWRYSVGTLLSFHQVAQYLCNIPPLKHLIVGWIWLKFAIGSKMKEGGKSEIMKANLHRLHFLKNHCKIWST